MAVAGKTDGPADGSVQARLSSRQPDAGKRCGNRIRWQGKGKRRSAGNIDAPSIDHPPARAEGKGVITGEGRCPKGCRPFLFWERYAEPAFLILGRHPRRGG